MTSMKLSLLIWVCWSWKNDEKFECLELDCGFCSPGPFHLPFKFQTFHFAPQSLVLFPLSVMGGVL